MNKTDIGINAGIIWRLLNAKGTLSFKEIEEYTQFEETYVMLALGWLARENKIDFFVFNEITKVELRESPPELYY